MQVYDEVLQKWTSLLKCNRILIEITNGHALFGYTEAPVVNIIYKSADKTSIAYTNLSILKNNFEFSKLQGYYFCTNNYSPKEIQQQIFIKGNGNFPYTFSKHYEAIDSFDIFKDKQSILNTLVKIPKQPIHYTFGLEFETSQGYIPEDICFRDGLIPLRDGSISGIEYSTVILKEESGLQLLYQQLQTLREYTNFNKECSLHIHLGGFPLNPDKIFRLYQICYSLESDLSCLLPKYTFNTSKYKDNNKNYCKSLDCYGTFKQMYSSLVGREFYNSLEQPHPCDVNRNRKWQISTRYFWCNFINILCYKVNKTIEFRFLRPTYNFNKIVLWLYIFNAILKYAEGEDNVYIDLEHILASCYSGKFNEWVFNGLESLKMLKENQDNNNDFIGADLSMEDKLFNNYE